MQSEGKARRRAGAHQQRRHHHVCPVGKLGRVYETGILKEMVNQSEGRSTQHWILLRVK
jgi:hypothetical protein